jgi:hypothetical protein
VALVGVMGFPSLDAVFAQVAAFSPMIRLRVDNYTQASPAILSEAEREASRILNEADLRIVWLNCPVRHSTTGSQDPCQEPLEVTDIVLRIVPQPTQNKFQDTVFGFSVVPVLATVYYNHALRRAKSDNAEFETPIILGSVIAHEVGHLLLGSNSHSISGVMQPRWERKQIRQAMTGTLLFTPGQAKLMQEETQTRMRLQTASVNERPVRTNGDSNLVGEKSTASEPSLDSYAVIGAKAAQEASLRGQIQIMQPSVLPLRILFVPHWKYIDTARIFRLHVPTGYTSAMFTHLPSRTTFIDSDRYMGEEWLGHWMAHELGHLAAGSPREDDAEKAAHEYRKRLKQARIETR